MNHHEERREHEGNAFDELSHRVIGETVPMKVGMRFIEYIPEGFQKNGTWVDVNLLGITREEWESNKLTQAIPSHVSRMGCE